VRVDQAPHWVITNAFQPQDERTFNRDYRHRSRSPGGYRRPYPPGPPEDYDYRRPRGYSPRRDDYRRRSPPRYHDDRYGRSPPRGPPRPMDDYGRPPPRYPDDPYDARGPPPARRPYDEPYMNGHGRPPYGGGPPSPRRPRSPGRAPYDGYERNRYW